MADILTFHAMNIDGPLPIPTEIIHVDSLVDGDEDEDLDDEDINEGFEDDELEDDEED
jgi:hypothetical protein